MWNRKNLLAMSSAIDCYRGSPSTTEAQRVALAPVAQYAGGDLAKLHPGDEMVRNARTMLCFECRVGSLYKCDQDSGWSACCEFMKQNGDQAMPASPQQPRASG